MIKEIGNLEREREEKGRGQNVKPISRSMIIRTCEQKRPRKFSNFPRKVQKRRLFEENTDTKALPPKSKIQNPKSH